MDDAAPSLRSVTPWLVVLFVLLFVLNSLGGWVRLSGSGVAIPQWPIVNGSLLPPFTDAGWQQVRAQYDADQARLEARVARGELTVANLGRAPRDQAEFRSMFITEWLHRFFAALVGVVGLGCLTVVLRRPAARQRIAVPFAIAGLLIATQAALGGLLVASGTGTHWLFLHQGNAAAIMACILVAILRLIIGPAPTATELRPRRAVQAIALAAVLAVWCELVVGALVAGSRNGGAFHVHDLDEVPLLWRHDLGLAWNLLDNAALHQWLHRTSGWGLALLLVALYTAAWWARYACGPRARLALMVSATFLPVQLVLGLANVAVGFSPFLSLAHQFMGMCLFLSLMLAWFDLRHEKAEAIHPSMAPPSSVGQVTT